MVKSCEQPLNMVESNLNECVRIRGEDCVAARISVVVPVYGTAKYLRKCLDSLAQQTLRDAEFLLIDDCTPDEAPAIMQEYMDRDPRFRVIRHEANRGLFAARLTGARHSQGEYITFLDSDDYVSVDFYRAALECADADGADVVMGDTVWVQADGSMVTRPVHEECLPADELMGEEIRNAFYAQELSCYSWHTIWNKVYRKALFDRCMPWFERLDRHIIMTEDIAFSCVLLYEAQKLRRIRGDGVFYCTHPSSSTSDAHKNRKRFFKNYEDIAQVFEFVDAFLKEKQDAEALAHFDAARRWYCRMWAEARENCAGSGESKEKAAQLTQRISPGYTDEMARDAGEIWWFDKQTTLWNDGVEKIKRAIAGLDGHHEQVISFDVFDTLIQRPFRQPTDLFCLLERKWQQENRRCILSFADARSEAEISARAWARGHKEDVELCDIYNALRETCGASEDCADAMRLAEMEAEIAFCMPRKTGMQLFRLAKAMGKRIVLISDMYLDRETIARMLNKCGVAGWVAFFLSNEQNALKWNGGLYKKAMKALSVKPADMLHIGDHWENDVVQPRALGMHAMHHPRAMDVFTDPRRTQIASLGLQSAASFAGEKSLQASLSFRCMQGLTACRFFDHGFSHNRPGAFFAGSPSLMGYYAIGGHVLSVAQWLIRSAKSRGVRKLVFLARDGWLIKQAADLLLQESDGVKTEYHPASRKCLLPALTVNPSDFYALPINVPSYSVSKLIRLLDFCTASLPEGEVRRMVEAAGFEWEAAFPGRYRYLEFMKWYLSNLYDGKRHQQAYNMLREYYEPVLTEGTACFDMGYSGRLQAALNQLACRSVPVYFIHSDEKDCPRLEDAYAFEAASFYGMKPGMSGAFREFLLSSDEPPCIGFERKDGAVRPVYGTSEYNAAARFFIRKAQAAAMDFVRDYMQTFGGAEAERLSGHVCSMPFESALRYLGEEDLSMLSDIRFEDTVFAGRDDLDLAVLVRDQSAQAENDGQGRLHRMAGMGTAKKLTIRRAVKLLLHDRGTLKAEVRQRLSGHPVLLKAGRALWRVLRGCRILVKGGQP